jgi:hypothetical protein
MPNDAVMTSSLRPHLPATGNRPITSPKTNEVVVEPILLPNHLVQSQVLEYKARTQAEWRRAQAANRGAAAREREEEAEGEERRRALSGLGAKAAACVCVGGEGKESCA